MLNAPPYPETIQAHLDAIITAITETLKTESIILLGSTARNEVSFLLDQQGDIELFSDYEFLIVVKKRPSSSQRNTLQAKLTQLEQQINNPNPLFHIDFIIREERRLKSLQPIIFMVEMKENGRVLYGRNCLSEIPTVTLENLDLYNANEILYKRLWAILIHLPENFIIEQNMNASEKRVTSYILCRNALDITTVLLPHEGILLPTYQQRVAKLHKIYPTLSFASNFGSRFPDFIQTCLELRQTLQFDTVSLLTWYEETIKYLTLALNQIGFEISVPSKGKVFNEWPISRGEWYNLAQMSKTHAQYSGIPAALKWLYAPKKSWLTAGLLEMHQSLIAWKQGDDITAVNQLKKSQQILNKLLMQKTAISPAPFPLCWLELRQEWAEFWRTYICLNDPKYIERFTRITTWPYQ